MFANYPFSTRFANGSGQRLVSRIQNVLARPTKGSADLGKALTGDAPIRYRHHAVAGNHICPYIGPQNKESTLGVTVLLKRVAFYPISVSAKRA